MDDDHHDCSNNSDDGCLCHGDPEKGFTVGVFLGFNIYCIIVAIWPALMHLANGMNPQWLAAYIFMWYQGYRFSEDEHGPDLQLEQKFLPYFEGVQATDLRGGCNLCVEPGGYMVPFSIAVFICLLPLCWFFCQYIVFIVVGTLCYVLIMVADLILLCLRCCRDLLKALLTKLGLYNLNIREEKTDRVDLEEPEVSEETTDLTDAEEGSYFDDYFDYINGAGSIFYLALLSTFIAFCVLIHKVRTESDVLATKLLAWACIINSVLQILILCLGWIRVLQSGCDSDAKDLFDSSTWSEEADRARKSLIKARHDRKKEESERRKEEESERRKEEESERRKEEESERRSAGSTSTNGQSALEKELSLLRKRVVDLEKENNSLLRKRVVDLERENKLVPVAIGLETENELVPVAKLEEAPIAANLEP